MPRTRRPCPEVASSRFAGPAAGERGRSGALFATTGDERADR
jgi:hypothetical protein